MRVGFEAEAVFEGLGEGYDEVQGSSTTSMSTSVYTERKVLERQTNIFAIKSSLACASLSSALIQIFRAIFCDATVSVVHALRPSM